ncbi:MAG: hypothetical protein NTZ93_04770 [Candidatus Beckwithbacteria bacterium]|nr:hypothetical protein [Candidatus Beckwithbacteria bacterium]
MPGWNIERVDFSAEDPLVASVNPSSVWTTILDQTIYQTTAKGLKIGSTHINANVIKPAGPPCPAAASIQVTNPGPWWQVVGGNVHANGGDVSSNIPSTATKPYLITEAANHTTGLASYTGALDTGYGTISEDGNNWQAQTTYHGGPTGYDYFNRRKLVNR